MRTARSSINLNLFNVQLAKGLNILEGIDRKMILARKSILLDRKWPLKSISSIPIDPLRPSECELSKTKVIKRTETFFTNVDTSFSSFPAKYAKNALSRGKLADNYSCRIKMLDEEKNRNWRTEYEAKVCGFGVTGGTSRFLSTSKEAGIGRAREGEVRGCWCKHLTKFSTSGERVLTSKHRSLRAPRNKAEWGNERRNWQHKKREHGARMKQAVNIGRLDKRWSEYGDEKRKKKSGGGDNRKLPSTQMTKTTTRACLIASKRF